jgi:predicted transposase/invertase (TIGR01784 family)
MTINRKNDYAFKRIFGHEDSKDVLARFLSVVLGVSIVPEELTLVQTELSPEYAADKNSVLDIQVRRSEFHEKMNVEMQQGNDGNIERRILYYWGRSFTGELKAGQDYSELPKQINIVIADFNVFDWKELTKFHGIFHVRERGEGLLFSDALEIHVLELPKLRRQSVKGKWSTLECWLLYLDNAGGEIMEQIAAQEPMIRRAMTIEEAFMKNESERYLYELREKGRHDFDNAMITAEKRGKTERNIEIARTMLAKNMPLDLTAEITGLPVEELENLHKGQFGITHLQ